MRVVILPPAADELEEARDWYERARRGLGDELVAEARVGLQQITSLPRGWAKLSRRTRRYRLNRFPYAIVYQVRSNAIVMVAFMHLHRKPGYWRDRLA